MMNGQELLEYACTQFENGAYDAALEAFILSYAKEYEQEWVLENIYNCYMSGNEAEFQENYNCWNTSEKPPYGSLTLDFVPYRDGAYYIYDKGVQRFLGVYSMDSVYNAVRQENFKKMEFSAFAVGMCWEWNHVPEILAEARFRKIYVVCQDIQRCASFFKVPELAEYAKNITLFSSMEEFQRFFHKHTSVYLPKLCIGTEEDKSMLLEIINQEHAYRLTPKGRNTDNVLLTIGIPTYGRGHLLLERLEMLLKLPFDAEIEIAVSKNGDKYHEEEYRQAAKIADARLNYHDCKEEITGTQNFGRVMEMSCGTYVMLVSDEDDVVPDALEHYLHLLCSGMDLSVIRSKTNNYYDHIIKRRFGACGVEGFQIAFLGMNYVSGLIIRRNDFLEENFSTMMQRFQENEYCNRYTHDCWCAVLAYRRGNILEEPVNLIIEGESAWDEEHKHNQSEMFPFYSTYQSRIEQMKGQIEFVRFLMEDDKEGVKQGLKIAMNKMLFLFNMARQFGHDLEHFEEKLNQGIDFVIDTIESFSFDQNQKLELLNFLGMCCEKALLQDAASTVNGR